MKNFLDLLATELKLQVTVNGNTMTVGLSEPMAFPIDDTVTIDGIEILPRYKHLAVNNKLTIDEPFYRWYHCVSGQGWLLTPH